MYKVNWKLCRFHQFLLTVIFLFWNWSVHILCVCACVTMLQHLQVFLSFFIVIAIIGHVYRRKLWLFARACVSFVCAKWNGNFTCQHICCLAAYMHVKMYKDIVNWNIDCVGIDSGAYVLDRSFSASTSIFLIWKYQFLTEIERIVTFIIQRHFSLSIIIAGWNYLIQRAVFSRIRNGTLSAGVVKCIFCNSEDPAGSNVVVFFLSSNTNAFDWYLFIRVAARDIIFVIVFVL